MQFYVDTQEATLADAYKTHYYNQSFRVYGTVHLRLKKKKKKKKDMYHTRARAL